MSLTVMSRTRGMVPTVTPADDPNVPHEWRTEAVEDHPRTGALTIRASCVHCGTIAEAECDPGDPPSLLAAVQTIRRWPIPGNCDAALVWQVMES